MVNMDVEIVENNEIFKAGVYTFSPKLATINFDFGRVLRNEVISHTEDIINTIVVAKKSSPVNSVIIHYNNATFTQLEIRTEGNILNIKKGFPTSQEGLGIQMINHSEFLNSILCAL